MALFIKEYNIIADTVEMLQGYIKLIEADPNHNIGYFDYAIHENFYPCPYLTIRCSPRTFENIAFLTGVKKGEIWC